MRRRFRLVPGVRTWSVLALAISAALAGSCADGDGTTGEVAIWDSAGVEIVVSPVPILFLPDGRLVAEEEDELDVERLVIYRIGSRNASPPSESS